VWADQAIFTSLPRRGRAGYHLVARSPGVCELEAQALAAWAPSHGGLIVDANNRISVNFHPLVTGRYAVARTCTGPAEYSGRGGQQLFTHSLIVDEAGLEAVGYQPFALYRDAMARGYLVYQPDPAAVLSPVVLSRLHRPRGASLRPELAASLDLNSLSRLREQLASGQTLRFAYSGDRTVLAEYLIETLPPEAARTTSFSTSLTPSATRPFLLSLVPAL